MSDMATSYDTKVSATLDEWIATVVAKRKMLPASVDDESTGQRRAIIALDALALSEENRDTQRATQGLLVAMIARESWWRFHPDGFDSLREYLRASGMSPSNVSILNSLGEVVVPFCDHHKIDIDEAITTREWPKLREAITALKCAARDDDPEAARGILGTVLTAVGRQSVRDKYAKKKHRLGHGTTFSQEDGRVVMIIILDHDDATGVLVRKIAGSVEWDLVGTTKKNPHSLEVVIND